MSIYTLGDPRPNAAEFPYTYFLPPADRIAAVRPGDSVKLVFCPTGPGRKWEAERMWVTVTQHDDDQFAGVLDNHPDDIPGLDVGEPVQFSGWNIIQIQFAPDRDEEPPPDDSREYWERCMVDTDVLTGGLAVDYIYREEPDLAAPDDKHPDSGWRIRGDQREASDEEIEARKASYVAIGAVLNEDDSWLHLVDAPVGSAFRRNFATNTYVPVEPD